MSRKKSQTNKAYKQKLRTLKKLQFIEKGGKEIDGRKRLTAADKRKISRAWSTHSEITQTKKLEFAVKKVKPKELKVFKELGYKTYKNKVYINNEGAKRVTIAHEMINGIKEIKIHKRGNQKDRTVYVVPSIRIHSLAEYLQNKSLHQGEFITGQFEGRSQFNKHWVSMEDFEKYLMDFQPQQPKDKNKKRSEKEQLELKRELFLKMSIIKFNQ